MYVYALDLHCFKLFNSTSNFFTESANWKIALSLYTFKTNFGTFSKIVQHLRINNGFKKE